MNVESEAAAAWGALAGLAAFIALAIVVGCVFYEYTIDARIYQEHTGEEWTMFDEIARDLHFRKSPTAAPPFHRGPK